MLSPSAHAGSRRRLAVTAVAAVLLLATGCSGTAGSAAAPTTAPSAARTPSAGGGPADDTGPPAPVLDGLVPAQGVLVGASVQASAGPGGIAAVADFESAVGRRLDFVHSYLPFEKRWPTNLDQAVLQTSRRLLISWNGMDMTRVAAGSDDDTIRERARAMRDAHIPLWLMFRGEMDRPNLRASVPSPEAYLAAYRHTRDLFRQEGAGQVSWVWCPTSKGFDEGRAAAYYPGDDQVDWICSDVYPGGDRVPFADAAKAFLSFSREHARPVMIGEFGISEGTGDRPAWLAGAAASVRANPQIKAIAYFNGNNDQKGPAAQLSLLGFPDAVQAFHDLLADPHFNPAGWPVHPRGR